MSHIKKHSSRIHTARTRLLFLNHKTITQKIILIIIIITIVLVSSIIIFSLIFNNERLIKDRISSLANNYYENYFYENLAIDENELSNVMSNYVENGFNSITLRQIIISTSTDSKTTEFLRKYCDETSTFIKFFPEAPFNKTSYHVEYTYSCNF